MAGPLSLRLLGGFEAHFATGPAPPLAKKTQALLAYLALEGGSTRPRAELATLLWGDTGDEQALQSLRKALSGLRQALGPAAESVLVIQDGTIGLNLAVVVVDALDFERQARDNAPSDLVEAVALYQGHLLAGLDLDEAPFNEWLLSKRERFRELALNTLGRLLDHQIGAGALDAAIDTASRVLALEPLHEPAHRALIQIYGKQGRRSAAARQYQLCVETLERELGVKPEPATEAAYRQSLETQPAPVPDVAHPPDTKNLAAPSFAFTVRQRLNPWVVTTVTVAIAIWIFIGSSFWLGENASSTPVTRRSVAILGMKNLSDRPEQAWLSTALTETIGAELMAGGQLRLVSPENLSRMQAALSPPLGVGLARKQLDDIGRTLGCDLVLSGAYLAVGGNLRVDVRIDDVASGEPVANATVSGLDANLLALVDGAGDQLRVHLGLAKAGAPERAAIRAAFPTSPTSRRLYFLGLDALKLRDGPRAAELLQQAIDAEPKLALAHASLATTWKLLGYDGRAARSATLALDASDRLSTEDRMNVQATFSEAAMDWPKAIEGYQKLWQAYPDNLEYGLKLANVQQIAGGYKNAEATIETMRKLPGLDGANPRIDLVAATVAEKGEDYRRALAASTRAADTALATKATLLLARARLKQGIDHNRLKENDKALERMAESRQLFESLGDSGGVADALRWEAAVLIVLTRVDAAEPKLVEALELSRPLGYVRLTTEILLQQSNVARQRRDLAAATVALEAALVSAREAGEPDALARTVNLLAALLRPAGGFTRARALYVEGEGLFRRLGTPAGIAAADAALNNIGVIDVLQGRFSDAQAAFEPLLAQDRQRDNKAGLMLRLSNLALMHALQGHLAESEAMNVEACKVYEALNNKLGLASCRVRLGLVWGRLGRTKEALGIANSLTAGDFSASTAAPWDFARLATLELETGQRAKAASVIADGLRLFGKLDNPPDYLLQFELARARVEAASGSTTGALARLDKAKTETDRLGLVPLGSEIDRVRGLISRAGEAR